MDLEGQRKCEVFYQTVTVVAAVVGFIVGYVKESFELSLYIFGGGVALAMLVCVPDWRLFRGKPLPWLPPNSQTRPSHKQSSSSSSSAAAANNNASSTNSAKNKAM